MILHDGKEYYPLETEKIFSDKDIVFYDRAARNKSYVYIDVTNKGSE